MTAARVGRRKGGAEEKIEMYVATDIAKGDARRCITVHSLKNRGEVEQFLKDEASRWRKVIEDNAIKVEN